MPPGCRATPILEPSVHYLVQFHSVHCSFRQAEAWSFASAFVTAESRLLLAPARNTVAYPLVFQHLSEPVRITLIRPEELNRPRFAGDFNS